MKFDIVVVVLMFVAIDVFGHSDTREDLRPCEIRQEDIDKLKGVDLKKLGKLLQEKLGDGTATKTVLVLIAAVSQNRLLAPVTNAVGKITVELAHDGGILDQLLSGGYKPGAPLDPVTTAAAHEIYDKLVGKCVTNELIRIGGELQHNPLLKVLPLKTLFPLLANIVGTVKKVLAPVINLLGSVVRPLLNEHNGSE